MANILIVDDEAQICDLISALLRERGYTTRSVGSGEAALQVAGELLPDLVLLDINLGGIDGFETLRRLRANAPGVPIIMMTSFGNVEAAVKAMKLGATDFIGKPFVNQELFANIETLLIMHSGARSDARGDAPTLIGDSPAFRRSLGLALKFAVPDINILILGETGTGKELFARTIHTASKRRNGPFVAVDCSMLAENLIESELFGHEKGAFTGALATRIGRLELAQGGTLFLDEIGNLPAEFQAKLLRVLQERSMERVGGRKSIRLDVRVISATNVNLKDAIAAGTFRQDLYYRLQGMTISLPPLRERSGDVGRLARKLAAQYAESFGLSFRGISESALDALDSYSWPGNVRELENAMKQAVVLAADVILPEHLPEEICGHLCSRTEPGTVCEDPGGEKRLKFEIEVQLGVREIDLKALGAQAAELAERSLLQALVRRGGMSGAHMARTLGVDPKTLRTKLRRYGLDHPRLVVDDDRLELDSFLPVTAA